MALLLEMTILRSTGAFQSRDFRDECKMATDGGNEKQSLGSFVKSQTKYGTTTTVVSKNRHTTYVKHTVVPGDTLARLALKYSVSVEQIKRDNKLWSNDSLFLKEFVFVPVTRDNSETLPENCDIVNLEEVRAALDFTQHKHEKSDAESVEKHSDNFVHRQTNGSINRDKEDIVTLPTESQKKLDTTKPSPLDFLSKYDSSIAQLKTNVQKMEQNAAYVYSVF